MSIEELVDTLQLLIWEFGITTLLVSEHFPKMDLLEFTVNLLHMEIEDGICFCWDSDNRLIDYCSMLLMFGEDQVTSIVKKINGIKTEFYLNFKDGYVRISTL